MVHVTLVKLNLMQKLDGGNIIIQLKVQNHQNTFDETPTTVVSNAPKNAKTSKNMETVVLEMASHRAINDKMQTRKKEVHFFFFSVCYIVFNCTWQLRWLVGLKLIQLEQQKTQLPFIILAKNLKPILYRVLRDT